MTSVKLKILSFITLTAIYYIIERWLNFLEGSNLYIIPDYLTIIDAILFVVVGMASVILLIKNKKSPEDTNPNVQYKRKHTEDLNKIYLRLCKAVMRHSHKDWKIVLPIEYREFSNLGAELEYMQLRNNNPWQTEYVEIEFHNHYKAYDYLPDALKHLEHKTYKEINQHWVKTEKLLEEFNKRPKFDQKLHETIESKMKESFPDFQKGYGENFESAYDPYVISDVVTNLWFVERTKFGFLEIREKYGTPSIITKYGTRPQLSSVDKNKLDLDKYKKLLDSLVTNDSLKEMYFDESKAHTEIFNELKMFQEKLSKMVRNHKYKVIDGKCDSCP